MNLLLTFLRDRSGDLAQYAIILLLVVVVTVSVLTDLGVDISSAIGNFDNTAFSGSGGSNTGGNPDGSPGGNRGGEIVPGPGPIPGPNPGPTQ